MNTKGALSNAAVSCSAECVKLLLDAGADVNNKEGSDALFLAVTSYSLECANLLLTAGVDVNSKNKHNETVLFYAKYGKYVEILLREGADVNIRNDDNITALYNAVCTGLVECVDLLINAGADVNITDNSGAPLLFQKESISHWNHHPTLMKCIKIVLREGFKVNVRNRNELTALTFFVKSLNFSPSARKTKHEEEFTM